MTERRADKDAVSRRRVLKGTAALGLTLCAAPRANAAPEPIVITPALTDAARREGKIVWYAALDLPISEAIARAFETKFPGIACRVERSGAERIFQRIGQEQASNINATDVAVSTDAAHFVAWKRSGWLEPFVPQDVAEHFAPTDRDADGMYTTLCLSLSGIGYNTKLVKREDAPRSFGDLLDPKWKGRIVKAHPGYSGTILTTTYALAHALGWSFYEKLAEQRVMQVQSAGDPPKKLGLGERAVQADGVDAILDQLKEQGQPVEFVYAAEGALRQAFSGVNLQRKSRAARGPRGFSFSQCARSGVALASTFGSRERRAQSAAQHRGRDPQRKLGGSLARLIGGVLRLRDDF